MVIKHCDTVLPPQDPIFPPHLPAPRQTHEHTHIPAPQLFKYILLFKLPINYCRIKIHETSFSFISFPGKKKKRKNNPESLFNWL